MAKHADGQLRAAASRRAFLARAGAAAAALAVVSRHVVGGEGQGGLAVVEPDLGDRLVDQGFSLLLLLPVEI